MVKRCFVTVGTTKFEELIRALDDGKQCGATIDAFVRAGFTHLTLQIGKGEYQPSNLTKASAGDGGGAGGAGSADTKSKSKPAAAAGTGGSGLIVEYFDYRPSLATIVNESDLIISHAGAGSILEALRARKSLIVVINETLMDNHQAELANALKAESYLLSCTPATLQTTLTGYLATAATAAAPQFKAFPPVNRTAFSELLNNEMGF